jgi:hypothetical protein
MSARDRMRKLRARQREGLVAISIEVEPTRLGHALVTSGLLPAGFDMTPDEAVVRHALAEAVEKLLAAFVVEAEGGIAA